MIIHGRTMTIDREETVPFGRASVRVVGIWKSLKRLAEMRPLPADIVCIRPPLYSARPAGVRCRAGVIYPALNSDTTLLRDIPPGANTMLLADGRNVRADNLLRIDREDVDREEVINVKAVRQSAESDTSTWVTLHGSLLLEHRVGASVQKMYSSGDEVETTLRLDASRGQSTVFISDIQAVRTSEYLRFCAASDQDPPDEMHRFDVYETESNAQGFYQLPPLQRVAQVQIEASGDGKKAVVTFQPDFSQSRNQVDFLIQESETPDSAEDNYA